MKFMHKAVVCLLTLTLLCSGTYASIRAEEAEVSEENNQETTQIVPENVRNILQVLGLMDESEIDSTGHVNRGYAAAVLMRFDNAYAGGTATGTMYADVWADTLYAYEIETASTCGYFFGTGEGRFSPENDITPAQMATVLMRLAGYPDSYIQTSSERGKLIRLVDSYDYLTYPNLANMLYTFLDINIVKFGSGLSGNRTNSSDTVLNNFFDTYKKEGIITENDVTSLWAGSDLKKNNVVISGNGENIVFDKGETDIDIMIGRYVEAYYKYDDSKRTSVCLHYDALEGQDDVVEIDLFDIDYDESDASQIEYYTSDSKNRRIKYNAKTAILYNGMYYADTVAILTKVNGKEGTITVIDNNNDGVADILNVEAYDTFLVNSVVLSSKTVFFKNTTQTLSLDEGDYDQFTLKDGKGYDFFIEDLVNGVVVSVAKSSAGASAKVIKVIVSEETVNATVTNTYKNDLGMDVLQLDNMDEYTLLSSVSVPNIGQGVIALLDAFGKVAWIDYSNAGEFAYGIITGVKKLERDAIVKVTMITAQNTIEQFDVSTKLLVDKTTYRDMDTLYAKLNRSDNINVGDYKLPAGVYPVRYKLRQDGTLWELDTDVWDAVAGENDNTLTLLGSGYHMVSVEMVLGGTYPLKSSIPVFRVSGSTSGGIIERDYLEDTKYTRMSNVQSLVSTKNKYHYAAYRVDKDSLFPDFLIVYGGWGHDYADSLFVVEKITSVYDETTGDVLRCLHGVDRGVDKQVLVSNFYTDTFDAIGLNCGDVIRYTTDTYGHLIHVEDSGSNAWVVKHNITPTSKTIDINNIGSGRTSLSEFRNDAYSTQMIFGYVKERRDNYITVAVISPNTHTLDGKRSSTDMSKETVLVKIPDSAPVTVYDPTKKDKVFAGTYDEILDYKYNGTNCSLVALHYRTVQLYDVVVLNNYSLYK